MLGSSKVERIQAVHLIPARTKYAIPTQTESCGGGQGNQDVQSSIPSTFIFVKTTKYSKM